MPPNQTDNPVFPPILFRGFLHQSAEDKIYPLKNFGDRLFLLSVAHILLGILRAVQSCCLELIMQN